MCFLFFFNQKPAYEMRISDCSSDVCSSDLLAMRDKISAGHPNHSGDFDLKHDRGGMVDVEFVTQYLVLCHAATHRVLVNNLGNIALLRLAAEAGLIPADLAPRAGAAYRTLRRTQPQLPPNGRAPWRERVQYG